MPNGNFTMSLPISILHVHKKARSGQGVAKFIVAIFNVVWFIWTSRNHSRFQCGPFTKHVIFSKVVVVVSLIGNLTLATIYHSIEDFEVLKRFKVLVHAVNAPSIKQIT